MEQLKRAVEEKGRVLSKDVLKVDTFLNHTVDPVLIGAIGKDFARHFQDQNITRVVTIESGGIAPALAAAYFLDVPLVYLKKSIPSTMDSPLSVCVHSFTKNTDYLLCAEAQLIEPGDSVLFIDDFLANGQAFLGVRQLVKQAGARLAGVGICIEKAWQDGHRIIEQSGLPLYIQASIASMDPDTGIVWNE